MLCPTLRRKIDAVTLMALALAATLALSACGGGGGGGPTDPLPGTEPPPGSDPSPSPAPSQGPAPQGMVMYALDNGNHLLMFGTESADAISRMVKITGMPLLKRMIGIDFRPSNGKLYGVGNDSRVYVIDTLSGAATPVGAPFSPGIVSSFDVHFGMDFDPATDRIRLISNELGGNWSINPDDGTAIVGKRPHYVAGDPNENKTPRIGGLAYIPSPAGGASGALRPSMAQRLLLGPSCDKMMMAMDTELSQMIGSCDPDNGDFTSLGPIPGVESLACVELDYSGPGGGLWLAGQKINNAFNSIGQVDPETGDIEWKIKLPPAVNFLVQSITFVIDQAAGSSNGSGTVDPATPGLSLSVAGAPILEEEAPPVDPVALCRGTSGS